MYRFVAAARSHVGLVRDNNEDSAFGGPYLLIVADGVGGAAAGEVASSTATYVASALSMLGRDDDPVQLLARAVEQAAAQLRAGAATDPARAGMGTTLTAVQSDGERFGLLQLGDSRAYLLRDGALSRLTRDHTLVQALVDAGRMTPEEARHSPFANIVLRSLGSGDEPLDPDLGYVDLAVGDRLLLCSDGLSDLVDDDRLAELLAGERDDAADALVEAALAAGGKDNVTCVVADVEEGPRVDTRGVLVGAVADLEHVLDPTSVR
ncbi:hypothetical protein GCM10023340_13530 [Nocardioides marinquilinus]|uniref:PPM-type phosphatase domain-containing protein n=1 Tax=Nocardioides marinquilinus TaxID=1210400 RepID=A0ABP9PDS2_9ACTN